MKKAVYLLIGLTLIFQPFIDTAAADEIDDLTREIQQKQSEYSETQKKIEQLKSEQEKLNQDLKDLGGKIAATQENINKLGVQIDSLRAQIADLDANLAVRAANLEKQKTFRDTVIREFYKQSQITTLEIVFADNKFSEISQRLAYHSSSVNQAKNVITTLNTEITQFEADKKIVEAGKRNLDTQLASVARARSNLVGQQVTTKNKLAEATKEKNAAESQISALSAAISGLSNRQRDLIASKFAASSQDTSVGESGPTSQALPPSPFTPGFAFASYGYPHRVGMNQYGAYGRAKAGQNFRQILEVYYNLNGADLKLTEGYPAPANISVEGYGSISFEDTYLKGIAEMPSSWPLDALKAQAIAARSYALAYTGGTGTICTDQRCQVYIGSNKGGAWEQAVNETRGMVLTHNGAPISAWYASTAGGYTRTSGDVWGNSRAWTVRLKDFGPNGAYDGPAYGNSPWYHKAWGDREGGSYCKSGGYNPWLSAGDVEDLFNSLMLSELDSSLNQYLSPPDGCNSAAKGWTSQQVKDELARRGKKDIGSVTTVFTSQDGTGYTDYIYVNSTNYGQTRFDGYQFKNIFNLRSIGNLVIWTSFYDVIIK